MNGKKLKKRKTMSPRPKKKLKQEGSTKKKSEKSEKDMNEDKGSSQFDSASENS